MKILGTSSLKALSRGKWTALVFLVCLMVSMVALSVSVNPVHAQGYYFVLKWGHYGSVSSSNPENGNFSYPCSIAVDSAGNVYVADTDNSRVEKFSSNGTFLTKWGMYGSVSSSNPENGNFSYPEGIAVDSAGNVYVADTENNRVEKFSSSGTFLGKWGMYGYATSTSPQNGNFSYPCSIAVDSAGNVYVADTDNCRVEKFSNLGAFLGKWGMYGSQNGNFSYPCGIAVDSAGNVYVLDTDNNRVQEFNGSGAFLRQWGNWGNGNGEFDYPRGVAVDSSGNVYVADTSNSRVEKFAFDDTPPATVIYEYGTAGSNSWFTSNVSIVFTADDTQTGVAETLYSLNGGATWSNYTVPLTISTEGNTTVKYYSVDRVGNKEAIRSKNVTIDKLPPSLALTTSIVNGTKIKSSNCTLSWKGNDTVSGIDHYLVRLDTGAWSNVGNTTTHSFTSLANGNHTVTIEAVDKAGNSKTYTLNFAVSTGGGLGLIWIALIGAIVAALLCAGAAVYMMMKNRQEEQPAAPPPLAPSAPPGPTRLVVQAEPAEIVADGKSTSMITVQLQDDSGKLMAALADTQVRVAATRGKLENPVVKILKGKESETTVITSSTESGPVTVSASAVGLTAIGTTLNFAEKKRFCMLCGAMMPFRAARCPKCGRTPPAGLDTKVCKNCNAVIPVVAKFCSECGAGQAD